MSDGGSSGRSRGVGDLFLTLVASPALVLFLKTLHLFDLAPLAHWSFNAEPAKFLVAAGGAILASARLNARRRRLTFLAGLVVFLVSLYIYDQVSTRPPTEASLASYDLAGYVSFFSTYLSFGLCIAQICLFFTAPAAGDVHGQLTTLSAAPERPSGAERRDTRLVVVVPAIVGGFTHWGPLLERLRREPALDGTRWVKWDHKRGKLSPVSAARLANSLKAAIDEQWIAHGPFDEVVLVGHSLGGLLVRSAYLLGCGVGNPRGHQAEWAPRVSRLILFAAVNRGANPKTRRDVWLASILGRAFPPLRRLLIWQIIRGSAFITTLRLEWIRYFASPDVKAPVVVQLVGTEDSLVTRQDSMDIEQFADSYVLDVPGGTHEDLYRLDTSDDPETRYALLRDPFVHLRPLKGEDRHFDGPKKVVIIMHGIRANNKTWVTGTKQAIQARWPDVEAIGLEHEYLSALKFAVPMTRRRHLTWFQDAYAEALANNPQAEISFIGHSNGTYLLGESLRSVAGMRFEHAVLAGSVLPRDFDWQTCFDRGQIKSLRVDGSSLDWPVGLLCSALRAVGMRDIGTGGFLGFTDAAVQKQPQVFWYKGGHSAPLGSENLPALAEFAVTGSMVAPSADAMGPEIRWFARLARAMVLVGPLIVIGLPAAILYAIFWGDRNVGLAAAAALVAILAFLEFN